MNIKTLVSLVFFFSLCINTLSFGSEIDSFSGDCDPLPDLTNTLNEKINKDLRDAVDNANNAARRRKLYFRGTLQPDCCDRQLLYQYIRKQFAGTLIGEFESYIDNLPMDLTLKTSFENSIYQDLTVEDAPTLASSKKLGTVIRVGNYLIGSDKFGHFFSEGWTCFSHAYKKESTDIDAAIFYGNFTESFYYGAISTGIYSFADLTANFNGMRFWNAIFAEHVDPLDNESQPEPYIQCRNNQWEIQRDFDWRDYIDPAWDERYNFSLFRNDTIFDKVKARMSVIENSEDTDCNCDDEERDEINHFLEGKYHLQKKHLLNLSGNGILPEALKPARLFLELIERTVGLQ